MDTATITLPDSPTATSHAVVAADSTDGSTVDNGTSGRGVVDAVAEAAPAGAEVVACADTHGAIHANGDDAAEAAGSVNKDEEEEDDDGSTGDEDVEDAIAVPETEGRRCRESVVRGNECGSGGRWASAGAWPLLGSLATPARPKRSAYSSSYTPSGTEATTKLPWPVTAGETARSGGHAIAATAKLRGDMSPSLSTRGGNASGTGVPVDGRGASPAKRADVDGGTNDDDDDDEEEDGDEEDEREAASAAADDRWAARPGAAAAPSRSSPPPVLAFDRRFRERWAAKERSLWSHCRTSPTPGSGVLMLVQSLRS